MDILLIDFVFRMLASFLAVVIFLAYVKPSWLSFFLGNSDNKKQINILFIVFYVVIFLSMFIQNTNEFKFERAKVEILEKNYWAAKATLEEITNNFENQEELAKLYKEIENEISRQENSR